MNARLIGMIQGRKDQSFDGECHLTNEEADEIIAALITETRYVFTADEVTNLAKHQMEGRWHPFTCANRGDENHRNVYGDLGALIPTVRGWICPFCDYQQDWAHGFMKGSI